MERFGLRTSYYAAEDELSAVGGEDVGHGEERVVSRYDCVGVCVYVAMRWVIQL